MESVILISLCVVLFENFIVLVYSVDENPPVDNKTLSKLNTFWGKAEKIELLKIFYATNTGKCNHRRRIKERWDNSNMSKKNQSARNLHERATAWIKKGEAEKLLTDEERQFKKYEPPKRRTKWTPEMKEDVIKFYHMSEKEKWGQSKRIKELWDAKYPKNLDITAQNLMVQLRYLLGRKGGLMPQKKMSFTNEMSEDLVRCYYMAPAGKGKRLKVMRELFIERHPEFSNATYDELRCQLFVFRTRKPKIYERIWKEVSEWDTLHHSWEPGETSGTRVEKPESLLKYQKDELCGRSDQYPDPNQNIFWSHHMFEELSSSSNHRTFSDVGTSHQIIHPMDQHTFPVLDTSLQFLRSSTSGDYSRWDSAQNQSDRKQRDSSKGKELKLDLDLHLR